MNSERGLSALSADRVLAALGVVSGRKRTAVSQCAAGSRAVRRLQGRPQASAPPKDRRLRCTLLGGFDCSISSVDLDAQRWPLRLPRHLLQLLLLQPGHQVARELAGELLWPDADPDTASKRLHHTTFQLRRLLADKFAAEDAATSLIQTGRGFIALSASIEVSTDVQDFEHLIAVARAPAADRGDGTVRREALERAVGLYRGDLLDGLAVDEWALERREQLRWEYLWSLEQLAAAKAAAGHHDVAVDLYQRLTDRQPANEAAHCALMELYARTGRFDRAVLQFAVCQKALLCELNVEPSPATLAVLDRLAADARQSQPIERSSQPCAAPFRPPQWRHPLQGRARECTEIEALLNAAGPRLITLYGEGGVGKTRLAYEVAARAQHGFNNGVVDVRLDGRALADETLTRRLQAFAPWLNGGKSACKAQPSTCDAHALLLLDGMQLLEGAGEWLRQLLDAMPHLRVLATSCRPIGIEHEHAYVVRGLPLDGCDGALALFARCAKQGLAERGADAPMRQICEALGGNPLAIEMAASMTCLLTPEQLSTALQAPLDILIDFDHAAEPSHRSMRGVIARSFGQLTCNARLALRTIVRAGGQIDEHDARLLLKRIWAPREIDSCLTQLVGLHLLQRNVDAAGDGNRHELRASACVKHFVRTSAPSSEEMRCMLMAYAHFHASHAGAVLRAEGSCAKRDLFVRPLASLEIV
jgi:DNA-binding SARP family transcriptional activator